MPTEASALLQPGTDLEPFAFRTLGLTRRDPTPTERAIERLEVMGLAWHAARMRARPPAPSR